jgi:hypothetical protein
VAAYQFDGNLNDSTCNEYHLSGRVGNYVESRDNTVNGAYGFNGVNGSLNSSFRLDGDFTISLWVKLQSEALNGGNCVLFPCYSGLYGFAGFGLGLEVNKGSIELLSMRKYAEEDIRSEFTYNCNFGTEWTHITIAVDNTGYDIDTGYDNTTCTLYVNGRRVKESDTYGMASFSPILGGGYIEVPDGYSGYGKFHVDDIVIYNHALNDEEVVKLYESGIEDVLK